MAVCTTVPINLSMSLFGLLTPPSIRKPKYEGVSKSFQTVRLERELQMVLLSPTRCSCLAIL